VVNSLHQIYQRSRSGWRVYPGAATDIAAGANGSVWVVGTNTVPGGFGIYRWTGSGWTGVPGGAVRIGLGPDGTPWLVNSVHQIYQGTAGTGTITPPDMQLQVPANDISIGASGASQRQLQFTHITWDAGTGPFEIDPTYNPSTGTATFRQAIFQSASPGVWSIDHYVPLAVMGVFNPPSDYQFPLTSFTLNAVNLDGSPGHVVATSMKTDYCITADAYVGGVPNTPDTTYIPQSNCTDPTRPLGWSVGWGDQYDQTDSGQPIILDGVADGTYILRGMVDPQHVLTESNASNDEVDTTLNISGNAVTVLSQRQTGSSQPAVTLTGPPDGASVSGPILITASAGATAPATVASVQFLLDGLPLGSPVTSPPYTWAWDASATSPGSHLLSARVTDSAGEMATAPVVSVSVTAGGGLQVDRSISQTGSNVVTTTPFSTSQAGETLVAFVDSDGPKGAAMQSTTLSGAGLTWSLVKKSNARSGDSEIWSARARSALTDATVTSTPEVGGYDQMLTVVGFEGAGGLGASSIASGATGGPAINLVTQGAGSLVFATGTDWDSAQPRSPGANQSMVSEWVDTGSGNTFWAQEGGSPTTTAGRTVLLNDTAPTADQWDLAAVEVRPAAAAPATSSPPTVSLVNPTNGQTLSATVPLAANVTGAAGYLSVQFMLDGFPLGGLLTSVPYAMRWDTTAATPGAHLLSARVTDTSGRVGTSAQVAVTVANPAPPMTCFVLQAHVTAHGTGTVTTPSFHTAVAGEVLVAFVTAEGPARRGQQTATVSGAGLPWVLVERANAQPGDSEVWMATTDRVLDHATVESSESAAGYEQDLTVIAMEGVSGIGASAGGSAARGTPSVRLTTTGATSLVFAAGNDPARAEARSLPDGWVLLDQMVDARIGRSSWTQYTNDPTGFAGSRITVADSRPPGDPWNLVAVELRNDDS
jgi:hypothetical protein